MMNKSFLLIGFAVLTVGLHGCEAWHGNEFGTHWEQGAESSARWRVNDDRDAQERILELDSTPTSLPIVDANYEKNENYT